MTRILLLLLLCTTMPIVAEAANPYDVQLNNGIRNSVAYSRLLIAQAHQSKADEETLLKMAALVSPDLPQVYFELARYSFSPSAGGVMASVDYVIQGIDAYGRNFWWSFTLMGSAFFAVILALLLTAVVLLVIRLFPDVPLIIHDVQEDHRRAFLLLALVILSVLSPLFFIAGLLILFGFYMRRADRAVVYAYLILLLCSPLLFKSATMFVDASSSGKFKAVIQENEAQGNDYAASVLGGSGDFPSLFSYALSLKREGRYNEAIPLFRTILERRKDPRVLVNLGNCYVGLYNFEESRKDNLEEAAKLYQEAISLRPLASAYYNLSQVYRELLDFPKGEEYFRTAVSIDRIAVSEYRAIAGRTPNRLVADETLSQKELWDYVRAHFGKVSTLGSSVLPPAAISVLALGLIAVFYLLNSRTRQKAYRCRKCATIMCGRCEKRIMWGQMCPRCFASLIKLNEMDARERVSRILTIYEQKRRRREKMKILSFILPGASFIYGGRILAGFLLMWPFLFLILLPLTNRLFVPDSRLVSHGFFSAAALVGAILVFLAANIATRQRIGSGWL